ncbi:MAG: MBL fold metallo-hydrolase [Oscillospiraceae bacterium]|nr:MBL fold metallo-hydrolase [Oscillospiraceae bacterium]
MKIRTLTLGEYQTNCYLVSDENGATAVIDPGYEPETILARAAQEKLQIEAVLLTHGHFDHVGGVRTIAGAARCPVWLSEKELTLPPFLTNGALYYTDLFREGAAVRVGKLCFTVLETPGHTPGSVCLRCETALFSGDTLFAGSYGRTDLPGGSPADMLNSLRRLAAIPENCAVLPGHGDRTTLDRERGWIR